MPPTKRKDPPTGAEEKDEKQHLLVIRHGDRWDYAHPEWLETTTRRGDPPLSKLGHQQARETGIFLDSYFAEHGIDAANITWLSSPFLRCLQTSDSALNAVTKMNTENIQIRPEYSVFEMDGHNGKMHASLPEMTERFHYFPRVNSSHESLFVPPLPEPREGLLGRCEKAVTHFNQRYKYKPSTVFVVVTHAASCVAIAKAASAMALNEITPAAPCGIFELTRTHQTDVWTMDAHDAPNSMNGYVKHVSDLSLKTTRPWNHFGPKGTDQYYTGPPTSHFAPLPTREDSDKICKEKRKRQRKIS